MENRCKNGCTYFIGDPFSTLWKTVAKTGAHILKGTRIPHPHPHPRV